MINVLIVNQPLGNRGDESAHKALVRLLLNEVGDIFIKNLFIDSSEQWSIEQFAVDDARVEYVNLHPFFTFSKLGTVALRKRWRRLLWDVHPFTRKIKREYDWADVVLCAPGGICMGAFQDWWHLYMLVWAKHCKRPLAYFGRSIGPFPDATDNERIFKTISYEMLHYFSFLSIRELESEQYAKEAGVNFIPTLDAAFLDNPMVLPLPYEIRSRIEGSPYMVFVPNNLLWHYAYRDRFAVDDLVTFYCDMMRVVIGYNPDLSIVMLPQVFGKGDMIDDLPFFRKIAEKMNDKRVIVTADCYSSDVQQTIIRDAQFVIGGRYHSIVFAINQNVPFIALSYEHKMTGLLEKLGKTDCMIDFSQTMFSETGKSSCLGKVQSMLPVIHKDYQCRDAAKKIAYSGFKSLVENCLK